MNDNVTPEVLAEIAPQLCRMSNDLRTAGDVEMVVFDDDGVAPSAITFADELWLIALRINGDVAMTEARRSLEQDR